MSRKKHNGSQTRPGAKSDRSNTSKAGDSRETSQGGWFSASSIRETIESVVIAFVLAFLFRTFEAEAFVIPTGSMAPTLMGRHYDVRCPECGYSFQVSASEEVDSKTNRSLGPNHKVVRCTCPMCRYPMPLLSSDTAFNGDRILVNKFAYQFADPQRWDVAVFKYPGEAATNFIKRIVGLPGETIRIRHGDLWVLHDGQPAQIARKPPRKLLAMLQPVYDNDFVLPAPIRNGWPARWQSFPTPGGSTASAWSTSEDHKTFSCASPDSGETWMRYQHFVPSVAQWESISRTSGLPVGMLHPRPQLITDFCSYNTNVNRQSAGSLFPSTIGLHWVGDLAVECELTVEKGVGEAVFELVEGGRRMQCRINLTTGQATLSISGLADFAPTAPTGVRGPGSFRVIFANVDDRLQLWVDGTPVFDPGADYPDLDNGRPQRADLAPVGIAAAGGAALRVSHLKVFRDIYYIAERRGTGRAGISDFEILPRDFSSPEGVADFMSDPTRWDAFDARREVEFPLADGQFLALGDNSPKSKDSRLWDPKEYFVSRKLLIGKALFIYWPHTWHRITGTRIPFPFFPNVGRMGFVR